VGYPFPHMHPVFVADMNGCRNNFCKQTNPLSHMQILNTVIPSPFFPNVRYCLCCDENAFCESSHGSSLEFLDQACLDVERTSWKHLSFSLCRSRNQWRRRPFSFSLIARSVYGLSKETFITKSSV
jgi:hypothetical protein